MSNTDFTTADWRKSTHSGGDSGQCVEIAALPAAIGIRDSKNTHRPALAVSPRAFDRFLQKIKTP
ncbi:DUF397 domain-containing protein [Actinocorallia aurantiaca]|uniref:DUF397 domain-containing protein n=1 Tax=Actinocorallia aurantiaca TaxID=46204 RepID=A0ABN3U6P3_9ACTN